MPAFAIIEGIGEGKIASRHFRNQLKALGWRQTTPEMAEVIISHSGGIFLLPESPQAQLFVHIHSSQRMPMQRLIAAHKHKIRYDMATRRTRGVRQTVGGVLNLGINGLYHLNVGRGLRMKDGFMNSDTFVSNLPSGKHLFICGLNDPLSDPDYFLEHTSEKHRYVSIKAGHDDCWHEPELYIPTIQDFVS